VTNKRTLASSGRRVVITGLGCVSPLGNDVESTWNAVLEGKSGAANITHFDSSKLDVHFACEVKNFDPATYINKKELRRMDRFIQLGLSAALQALEQSKLSVENTPAPQIGVLMSSGIGGLPLIEAQHLIGLEKPDRMTPFFIPGTIINLLPGQIALAKGFQGPNHSIVSACSSSAHAIGEAVRLIERGDIEACVAGGSEATISLLGIAGFAAMKALSTRNDAPEKASRPFDVDRDGFVMGEGGACLVLESLENARRRGATILGEVAGYGLNCDAYHMTSPSEGGVGAAACMKLALADAGLDGSTVDHINMHGTSTSAGDIAESQGIESVFGARAKDIHCVSTKSMTGHLLGGAGALEALVTTLAILRETCPPTINIDNQDPECRLNYTAWKPVKKKIRAALSNSFGFGGTNASLLLKRFED
jgi:3-oxoacyl-[acyl-carrier-protein] synthase II